MKRLTLYVSLLIVILLKAPPALSQTALDNGFAETLNEGGIMKLEAGSFHYDESRRTYTASGSVHIEFRHFTIDASNFIIDNNESRAGTDDYFELNMGDLVFTGDSFSYNYKEERGEMKDVTARMEGMNFAAAGMELLPGGEMLMKDVTATTCCLHNKEYHVEAKTVHIHPDGRAKFNKLSFYLKGHRLLKWPSYSMKLFGEGDIDAGMDVGNWVFSPPSLGYSDYGGVAVKADVSRKMKKDSQLGLYANYYADGGLFTEARLSRPVGEYNTVLRLGKRYKENTGYFRYFGPVQVWNLPMLEVSRPAWRLWDTKLILSSQFEIGRIKEAHLKEPLDRLFANFDVKYPLNKNGKLKYVLLGDGRYAIYTNYRKYRIWGSGLEISTGNPDDIFFRLQYMTFRHEGSTPLFSDLVDTNDKLFYYNVLKISSRNRIMVDLQYDMEDSDIDEVVYGFVRHWECLKFTVSWRTEQQSIGLRMQIKVPGRNTD